MRSMLNASRHATGQGEKSKIKKIFIINKEIK